MFPDFCLIVKERIEDGANEKAALRLFSNFPFVCINFDFSWLNKECLVRSYIRASLIS